MPPPVTVAAILRVLIEIAAPSTPNDGRVSVATVPRVAPGAAIELSVTILDTPLPGAPVELWLWSTDVELADNRFDGRDVVDPLATQPRMRARMNAPTQPGPHVIHGRLSYLSCDEQRCRTRRAAVQWVVEVTPPVAAPVPGR